MYDTKIQTAMKRTILFISAIVLISLSSCISLDFGEGISGNGNVITQSMDIEGFTGIHTSSGIDVTLSQADDYFVELEADENLHDHIIVERRGDMLYIGTEHNIYRAKSRRVNVEMPVLEELKISSAGDIKGGTPFEVEDLEIDVSSAGDLELEVMADAIDLSISSSGDCRLRGEARELEARLSSAGDLHAFDLYAGVVKVRVSSAGDARVTAGKEISMVVTSAGNIYYRGDAAVKESRTSSAGDIIKKD